MTRLEQIEAELMAYRSGWVQYDRDHVRDLQTERRVLLAEKCGCGGLCDSKEPCPMAYNAKAAR